MIDTSVHKLVPRHEILSKKEREELLNKFGINEEQLPKIFRSDPVSKKMNVKVGDTIRITRNSITAGESVYYRIVVEK